MTYLIEPNRALWSSYQGHESYKVGLGWYQNAIGSTLTEMGVKPHDHKVFILNKNLADTYSKISCFVKGRKLSITVLKEELAEVKLFSTNGRLVYISEKKKLESGINSIDFPNELSNGIYMISILGEGVSFQKQLVVP